LHSSPWKGLNGRARLPITRGMSIEATLARVDAIRQAAADPARLIGSGVGATGGSEAPAATGSQFAAALEQAAGAETAQPATPASGVGLGSTAPAAYYGSVPGLAGTPAGTGGGGRVVAAASSQVGQSEQPPGSNESPAIAEYRAATAGAEPGAPWCAYFVSWAARQAGEPIGPAGRGLGSVSAIWSWAQGAGRAMPNGPGVVPRPGDLIVFGGEHVGIVREVLPDGRIATIEGNYENRVSANMRSASEASGYVSMS
jgi:hypothetical protein